MTPEERFSELNQLSHAVIEAWYAVVYKAEEHDVLWPLEWIEDYLSARTHELLQEHPHLRLDPPLKRRAA